VNNATYLNYLEAARMDFLDSIGFDYNEFLEKGYGLYVVRVEIRYLSPALLNDRITVVTEPVKRKRLSGVFHQTVLRDSTELCDAYLTWTCVNSRGRPIPLPEEFDYPEFLTPENSGS
jgi:acyl-CoA thioester hydrolase